MAGIYLHIPFCTQACHYCDFHFSTNLGIKNDLIHAMASEISMQHHYLQEEVINTVYFGGGTPSLLNKNELSLLLTSLYKTHHLAPDAEITIETNPDDLSLEKLSDFKSLGINRLSIGIQSFDDAILKYLNRIHQADTAIRAVEMARETGFENISIDLIYAIPGLSNPAWEKNIEKAIALHPEHISAYTLTIEEKTAFGNRMAKGELKPVDETLAAGQLETLMAALKTAGYVQYEISNFALSGFESRHNSSYWKGDRYLGIGPGAHSFNRISRQHNIANNHRYVRSLREKVIPFEIEMLKKEDHINEYILTTLRTEKGCNIEKLKTDFGHDLLQLHDRYLKELVNHKLVIIQDSILKLTEPGRLLADKISSDLFLLK